MISVMGRLLSVKEAAAALNKTEKGIRGWIADRRIGFVKVGRRTMIPENQILEVIARGYHPPSN